MLLREIVGSGGTGEAGQQAAGSQPADPVPSGLSNTQVPAFLAIQVMSQPACCTWWQAGMSCLQLYGLLRNCRGLARRLISCSLDCLLW